MFCSWVLFIRGLQPRDAASALADGVSQAERTMQPLDLHFGDFGGGCRKLCGLLGSKVNDSPLGKDTF